jgi:hypothetical protein
MKSIYIFFACLLFMTTAVYAGQADVVAAKVTRTGNDTYKFDGRCVTQMKVGSTMRTNGM